ncbi:MAG: hypothetical protein H6613_12050 [Ignavibacteriales bacterium]|nr:hypothetical protein [Ignavibacteriales bacterium]
MKNTPIDKLEEGLEEISTEDLAARKREISQAMNEKIREYKLHALAEINLKNKWEHTCSVK